MKRIRVELNANLDCSAACPNCDRGVAEFPNRTEWMTVNQIDRFIQALREKRDIVVERLKWVGGEPLVHPEFRAIYDRLADAVQEALIGCVKISTNCVSKIPADLPKRNGVRWMRSPLKTKQHLPFYWHPEDVEQPTHGFCSHPRKCGLSLSMYGWLPCSPAILISGAFDLEHLYRPIEDIPTEPWGVDLCSHCVYSTPKAFRNQILADHPFDFTDASPRWQAGLARYSAAHGTPVKMPCGPSAPQLVEIEPMR